MQIIGFLMHRLAIRPKYVNLTGRGLCLFANASFAVVLAMPLPAHALTVSADVTSNAVWSKSQSPIIVQGDVAVDRGATLTVEPGVEIRMEQAASFTVRQGAVRAVGTQSEPIVITSAKTAPAAGDWGVWRFTEGTVGGETQFDNVRIEYGSGVVIEKASPMLNRVAIWFHDGPAVRMDLESSPAGIGLSAEGNTLNAITVPEGAISGQVSWALVGIPYLVEQGLIEVGRADMAMEPADIRIPTNSSRPLRLVLKEPAPAGGSVVTFTSSAPDTVDVAPSLTLPQGASEAIFQVQSGRERQAIITAAQAELGSATAEVHVYAPPVLSLYPGNSSLLVDSTYEAYLYLSKAAPSGGLTVKLKSEPAGAMNHPASVFVPTGEKRAEFTVRGNRPHASTQLSVEAEGYVPATVDLVYKDQITFRDIPQLTALVGDPSVLPMHANEILPTDGVAVQLSSSNSSVLTVNPNEAILRRESGESLSTPRVTFTGVSTGHAHVKASWGGMTNKVVDIAVKRLTELYIAEDEEQSLLVGEGLIRTVTVMRDTNSDSYHENRDVWVNLRCEDDSVCRAKRVLVPGNSGSERVPLEGLKLGSTKLIAEADFSQTASVDVSVVKPYLVFTNLISSPLETRRFVSKRQGFQVCLSASKEAPLVLQYLAGFDIKMKIRLVGQNPVGVVSDIYDEFEGGNVVVEATIENGRHCTPALFAGVSSRPVNIESRRLRLMMPPIYPSL